MLSLLKIFKKLEKKGLPLAKTIVVSSEKDLGKLEFPYFMKISIAGHKLSQGGVVKVSDINEAKEKFSKLKKRFAGEKIVIQEAVDGVEMVLGLKEDKVFGKVLMIGSGGSNIEEKGDVGFRAIPVSRDEILDVVKDLKDYNLIKNKDIKGFVNLALKVSKLDFKELDLNPVFIFQGKVVIVDARGE